MKSSLLLYSPKVINLFIFTISENSCSAIKERKLGEKLYLLSSQICLKLTAGIQTILKCIQGIL
jgi:hypothetical protein